MKNSFIIEGMCEKIMLKNSQVIRFKVKCVGKNQTKSVILTSFDPSKFDFIEELCNNNIEHEFKCIVYENAYKKKDEWIYNTVVQVKNM